MKKNHKSNIGLTYYLIKVNVRKIQNGNHQYVFQLGSLKIPHMRTGEKTISVRTSRLYIVFCIVRKLKTYSYITRSTDK
jgi:hypothetical protein